MKNWYKSKTIWFNIIGLIVTLAGELTTAFPAGNVAKIAGSVLIVGNIILRLITTTQIGTEKQ